MLKLKWLAGCLALTVLSSSTTVFAEQPRFSDINTSYAKESIEFLDKQGIMKGVSTDRFAPDQQISRKHFAIVLAKTLGIQPLFPYQPTFIDLDRTQSEYGYVEALVKLGLLTGTGESKYNGDQVITRQDAAVILYRALANDTSPDAQDAGKDTMFLPRKPLTRAETAVIAHRVFERGNLIGDYFWGVSPTGLEIKVGEQKQITILSQKALLAYTPVFGLDNPEIGSLSIDGTFTATKPGKGLITVNVGNRHHDIIVTVHE